jgi:hypothetical protein
VTSRFATPLADTTGEIPGSAGAREDRITAALASLESESRRLERLGFETPLARVHAQRRYWRFVRALYTVADSAATEPRLP